MPGPVPLNKSDVFQSLAEVIGTEAASSLCRDLGGRRIYVPAEIGSDHPIFKAVGEKNAALLAEYFHRCVLTVPKGLQRRDQVLDYRRTTTMTIREIADATSYTEANVYKILKEAGGTHALTEEVGGDEDKICVVTVARRVAGEDAATRIRAYFAGTRIYIPRSMPKDHEFSLLVGWDAAKLIAAEIGGTHSDVVSGSTERVKSLENAIRWASFAGLACRHIAGLVDRTDRHVRHVMSGLRRIGRLPPKEDSNA